MSLNAKVVETCQFTDAKSLRDWLNLWTDKQLAVMWTENNQSETLSIEYRDNDMEDGSHTYDLRFR